MKITGNRTRRHWAATLTTLAVAAGITLAGPAGQAQAADGTDGAQWQDLTSDVRVGVYHDGAWTDIAAGIMRLDTDHDGSFETPVYCIEPWTHVTPAVNHAGGYHSYDWDTYQATTPLWQQNRAKIASLLAHSYPNVSMTQMLTDAGLRADAMTEPFAAAKTANADTGAAANVGFSTVPAGTAGTLIGPVQLKSTTAATVNLLPAEGATIRRVCGSRPPTARPSPAPWPPGPTSTSRSPPTRPPGAHCSARRSPRRSRPLHPRASVPPWCGW